MNEVVDTTETITPPVTQAQGEENSTPASAADVPGQDKGEEGHKPKKDNFQKAIDRQTRKYYEEKARREVLEEELHRLRNANGGHEPSQAKQDPDAEPDPDTFGDPREYQKALTRWTVQQDKKAESQSEARSKANATSQEMDKAFAEREEKHREASDGYDDAVENLHEARIGYPPKVLEFIREADEGPALLEYLGNNLKEARRIAGLSDVRAIAELARLDRKASTAPAKPEEKKKSGAPDPVTPLKNRAGLEKASDDMSDEEWFKRRESEVKKRR